MYFTGRVVGYELSVVGCELSVDYLSLIPFPSCLVPHAFPLIPRALCLMPFPSPLLPIPPQSRFQSAGEVCKVCIADQMSSLAHIRKGAEDITGTVWSVDGF
jgi:hypothetical protein